MLCQQCEIYKPNTKDIQGSKLPNIENLLAKVLSESPLSEKYMSQI